MARRADAGPFQIGDGFLDKYQIGGVLGHGGQAWVYGARHRAIGREDAIKVVYSGEGLTQEMLDRAKAEAWVLGQFDHPNIVRMYDAGLTKIKGQLLFYIVMEMLKGRALRNVLADYGPLEVVEVLRLGIKIAKAVHVAHEKNIIHRDLKPDNIFIVQGSEPKVLDFGIARMLDEIGLTTRRPGGVLGTLIYMSPEQARGESPLTAQTDVFSLGTVLFEALMGMTPTELIFRRDLAAQNEPSRKAQMVDYAPIQVSRKPPLLSQLDERIPLYVAQAIQRAIAKSAEQRFATLVDFAAALQVCLDTCVRDAEASGRAIASRDLSLPAPRPQNEAPRPRQETAKHWPANGDVGASGQEVTEVIKAVAPASPVDGVISRPPSAETAPLGTGVSLQSPPAPKVEAKEKRSSNPPDSVARKVRPSQSVPNPLLAEMWTLEPRSTPPVTRAPSSAPPRTHARRTSAWSGTAQLAGARIALALAGTVFGATVGVAGARARSHFVGQDRTSTMQAASHVAAVQYPAVAMRTSAPIAPTPGAIAATAPLQVSAAKTAPVVPTASVRIASTARSTPLPAHVLNVVPARLAAPATSSPNSASPSPAEEAPLVPRKKAIYGD